LRRIRASGAGQEPSTGRLHAVQIERLSGDLDCQWWDPRPAAHDSAAAGSFRRRQHRADSDDGPQSRRRPEQPRVAAL